MANLLANKSAIFNFLAKIKYSFLIPYLSYLYAKSQLNPTIFGHLANLAIFGHNSLFRGGDQLARIWDEL